MKNNHEVYIHTEGVPTGKPLVTSADASVEQLLEQARHENIAIADLKTVVVFAEDSAEELEKSSKLNDKGPPPKHIHCHRCRSVKVTVSYNGEQSHDFPPSAKVRAIIAWAKSKFGIDKKEVCVIRLQSAAGDVIDADSHLGSYVEFPACVITVYLTPLCQIKG